MLPYKAAFDHLLPLSRENVLSFFCRYIYTPMKRSVNQILEIPKPFTIMTDSMVRALEDVYKKFISATRPHLHPLMDIDERLIADLVQVVKRNILHHTNEAGLAEVEKYVTDFLTSKTLAMAKNLVRPGFAGAASKEKLCESHRQARIEIVRLMYLRACQMAMTTGDHMVLKRARAIAWYSSENFDLGLILESTCPGCNAMGRISLKKLDDPDAFSFSCERCSHAYNWHHEQNRYQNVLLLAELTRSV